MSDSPGLDPDLLNLPSLRAALFHHDISRVYKILVREGISQRQIAELVGQSQSEVSEIINGRQVQGYDVLVQIANGLGLPRGAMGLAYDGDSTEPAAEEVDEDVERRNFLNALRIRPSYDVRCNALDTIVLATVALDAGEASIGIPEARRALSLVTQVGSQRARDRLSPMVQVLAARSDSTSRELAVHARRVSQVPSQRV